MWEVDLPQKVGPQEKKGVFLSLTPGSSHESGLAPGIALTAGGLSEPPGGPVGLLKRGEGGLRGLHNEEVNVQKFPLKWNMTGGLCSGSLGTKLITSTPPIKTFITSFSRARKVMCEAFDWM